MWCEGHSPSGFPARSSFAPALLSCLVERSIYLPEPCAYGKLHLSFFWIPFSLIKCMILVKPLLPFFTPACHLFTATCVSLLTRQMLVWQHPTPFLVLFIEQLKVFLKKKNKNNTEPCPEAFFPFCRRSLNTIRFPSCVADTLEKFMQLKSKIKHYCNQWERQGVMVTCWELHSMLGKVLFYPYNFCTGRFMASQGIILPWDHSCQGHLWPCPGCRLENFSFSGLDIADH